MGIFGTSQADPANLTDSGSPLWLNTVFGMPPSAGFPPQPAPAQPQAASIPVGDYQMPRIGAASSFTPPPVDPATAEAAAPAPPASNPVSGFFNRASAALDSIAHGGSLRGAVTGDYTDPQSVKQRDLERQRQAYLGTGVFSPSEATIATINPEAAKVLIAQKLGADKVKFAQLKDSLGAEHPAFVNTSDQTINGMPVAEWNKRNASSNSSGLGDMSKTGAEYLATIPAAQRGTVQAMVEGRLAPPSSFALSKPYWQNMIAAAQNVDPTFDATNWGGRVAGVKDYSAGKSSDMVRSANQALHHTNALLDSMTALNNGNYPALNWVENKANEAMGAGEPGAFVTNAHAVADEMGKMFKGGNLSDSEIRAWEENLSPNMSPAQQRAQIGKLRDLLQGSLQALDEKRVASMGQAAADKAGPLIKPEGQAVLKRIDAWLKAGTGSGNTTKSGVSWSVVQ